MDDKDNAEVAAVLFFDECMTKLSECKPNCHKKQNIACKHRLNFNVEIIYTDGSRSGFAKGQSDYELTHCIFDFIRERKFARNGNSRRPIFVLVTIDGKFLGAAKKEAAKKKDATLVFNAAEDTVSRGPVSVFIYHIKVGDHAGAAQKRYSVIQKLNRYLDFLLAPI